MTVKVSRPSIDIRGTLDELNKPSGIAGNAMLAAETPQEQFNLIGAGRKNLIINGAMQVSQRGDYSNATTSSTAFFVDRWKNDANVATTIQRTTGVDIAGTHAVCEGLKLVATGSGGASYVGIRQPIENPMQYIGRTFTYSGWVKSNRATYLETFIQGSTQTAASAPHSGGGAWERLSVTFTMTGTPSTAWYVDVFMDEGAYAVGAIATGDYFEATMLQLELGSVATPFEHRSYGEELALCQRYYEVINEMDGVASAVCNAAQYSSTHVFGVLRYAVAKRAVPSISLPPASNFKVYSTAASTVPTANGVDMPDEYSCRLVMYATGTGGNSCWIETQGSSSTPFAIDAEL